MTAPAADGADGTAPDPAGVTPPWDEVTAGASHFLDQVLRGEAEMPRDLTTALERVFDAVPVAIEKEESYLSPLQAMRDRINLIGYGIAARMGPKSQQKTLLGQIKGEWAETTGHRLPGSFGCCEDTELLQAVLDVAEPAWAQWQTRPTWAERKRAENQAGQGSLFGGEAA